MFYENTYKAMKLHRYDITRIVRIFRKKLNMENNLKINVADVLENKLPQIINGFNYEAVNDTDLLTSEAEYDILNNKLYIRESTYEYALDGCPHSRLTFGHEFCHIICHPIVRLCKIKQGIIIPKENNPEWQANVFGGEFLAPSYLIGNRTVEEIESDFNVSHTCAKIQKREHNRNMILLGWKA